MKKIATISASMLVLGAASLAAADFKNISAESETGITSTSEFRTSKLSTRTSESEPRILTPGIETVENQQPVRSKASIRRVMSGTIEVESCQDAYWPKIPDQCLERIDSSELPGA
jgi:hypothetical protein